MLGMYRNVRGVWSMSGLDKLRGFNTRRKSSARVPYENYELPKSSEKGQPFVDWNAVINEVELRHGTNGKPVRIIRKKKETKK